MANTLRSAEQQANTLRSAEQQANTLRSAEQQANTLRSAEQQANTLRSAEQQANTLRSAEQQANTLRSAEQQANTLRSAEQQANTLRSAEQQANTLRSAEQQANTLRSAEQQANTLRSAEQQANTLRSAEQQANTLRSAEQQANTLRSAERQANTLRSAEQQANTLIQNLYLESAVLAMNLRVTASDSSAGAMPKRRVRDNTDTRADVNHHHPHPATNIQCPDAAPLTSGDVPRPDHNTLTHRQVDFMFVEPHILTGYRLTNQPWRYYLRSAFWLHNETLNVWTHAIGCLCVLTRTWALCRALGGFWNPRSVPVLGLALGCLLTNLLSSLAHLLHTKSQRHHYVLYFMDYAGITFYNLGNSIGSMYSCSHPLMFAQLDGVYLPIIVALGWGSFVACALARLRFKGHFSVRRKVILVMVFVTKAFFISWPIAGRYVDCLRDPQCSLASLHHITVVFVFFTLDGVCFLAHAPERWWPGKFDIWGHGHQWFHALTVVTQQLQLHALHVDLVTLERGHHAADSLDGSTILAFFLCLGLANALSVRVLSSAVNRKVAEMQGLGSGDGGDGDHHRH
ncbi:hypothetical protein ACOMHN_036444 [Nucella lapillus]